MKPEQTEPVVRKMKRDKERDGKRSPGRKYRDQSIRKQRAAKRARQGR